MTQKDMTQKETVRTNYASDTERLQPAAGGVFHRISWSAVIAGGLVALTIQLVLSLLGLSIGFGLIDPAQEPGAGLSGFGTGAAWWWILSSLLSLFAGGWVAGRMAGVPRRIGGALHGLVTWSFVTVFTVVLLGFGIGTLIGGLLGAVGHGAEALQQAVQGVEVEGTTTSRQEEGGARQALDGVVQEAREILRETDTPELQPQELEERGEEALSTVEQHLRAAVTHPQEADERLRQAFDTVWGEARKVAGAADREALVNALVKETDLTREEARETVGRWDQALQKARQEAEQAGENLAEKAREQAGEAADALASAAFWTFLGLVLGAACAAGGGLLGSPPRVMEVRT